jgi:hypothetical protein
VAGKMLPILEKVKNNGQLLSTFKTPESQIRLLWSLLVLGKAESIISPSEVVSIIKNIKISSLDPFHYKLTIQLLNLTIAIPAYQLVIPYDEFYTQISSLSSEIREELILADSTSKTPDSLRLDLKQKLEVLLKEFTPKPKKRGG